MELPLSWIRTPRNNICYTQTALRYKQARWVCFGAIPVNTPLDDWLHSLTTDRREPLIIRGCSAPLARALQKRHFDLMAIGMEGVIQLSSFHPRPSLRALERRALRHGYVVPFRVDKNCRAAMQDVWDASVYARRPKLRKLFRNDMETPLDGFAFLNEQGAWQAYITLSLNHPSKCHLEQMVRRSKAPTGVMEALLLQAIRTASRDGYGMFSLGEVPFFFPRGFRPGLKARWVAVLGRALKPLYNAESLMRFKQKFQPQWQAVYVCGHPRVSPLHLLEMAWHSRYLHQLGSRWFK